MNPQGRPHSTFATLNCILWPAKFFPFGISEKIFALCGLTKADTRERNPQNMDCAVKTFRILLRIYLP